MTLRIKKPKIKLYNQINNRIRYENATPQKAYKISKKTFMINIKIKVDAALSRKIN